MAKRQKYGSEETKTATRPIMLKTAQQEQSGPSEQRAKAGSSKEQWQRGGRQPARATGCNGITSTDAATTGKCDESEASTKGAASARSKS